MNRTVLQIPIDVALRRKAEMGAQEEGFSSLQETIRVFLKKLSERKIGITYKETEKSLQLSPRSIKRYNKISEDFEKGKNIYTAKDVDDLMKQLNEDPLS